MEPYIPLKTSHDVDGIRRACRLAELTLRRLGGCLAPGVSTLELDRRAAACLGAAGARAALRNGFPGTICASVNQVAVHGVPSREVVLQSGDILTIDLTVELEGWCADAAWSYGVGEVGADRRRLLEAAWRACLAGVGAAKAGARFGDIGDAVQREASRSGCRVVEEFVGHGIGRRVHEEPMVPHVGAAGCGQRIVPGMVFTIEPTLTLGDGRLERAADGWGLVLPDGDCAAQFEHMVAVFADHTDLLTLTMPPENPPWQAAGR